MSKYLGPIHFWVYNKIQIQQDIVEEIINLSNDILPGLKQELELRYGTLEKRPLEEVIDESNIHWWLQAHVNQVENQLAYSVTVLLKNNKTGFEAIESIFFEKGKEIGTAAHFENAMEAYKLLNDSLLDGMPCDHANMVVEQDEEKVIWKRNQCVHKSYWDELGGDIEVYYNFRKAFIQGILFGSAFVFESVDDITSMIRRS